MRRRRAFVSLRGRGERNGADVYEILIDYTCILPQIRTMRYITAREAWYYTPLIRSPPSYRIAERKLCDGQPYFFARQKSRFPLSLSLSHWAKIFASLLTIGRAENICAFDTFSIFAPLFSAIFDDVCVCVCSRARLILCDTEIGLQTSGRALDHNRAAACNN